MELPKILVATPTCDKFDYCTGEYSRAVKNLTYKNCDVFLVDNSRSMEFFNKIKSSFDTIHVDPISHDHKEILVQCKEIIRRKVLDEGYDYYLNIDYDVIPPLDVIERLLMHGKKIMTGVYYKRFTVDFGKGRKEVIWPVIYKDIPEMPDKMHLCTDLEVEFPRLMEIKACGSGCFLVHREVLEKIPFRCDETTADDLLYCYDARKIGYRIFCDTSVKCRHLIDRPRK